MRQVRASKDQLEAAAAAATFRNHFLESLAAENGPIVLRANERDMVLGLSWSLASFGLVLAFVDECTVDVFTAETPAHARLLGHPDPIPLRCTRSELERTPAGERDSLQLTDEEIEALDPATASAYVVACLLDAEPWVVCADEAATWLPFITAPGEIRGMADEMHELVSGIAFDLLNAAPRGNRVEAELKRAMRVEAARRIRQLRPDARARLVASRAFRDLTVPPAELLARAIAADAWLQGHPDQGQVRTDLVWSLIEDLPAEAAIATTEAALR